MKSLSILRHSVLQIIRQPISVLRIFLLPLSLTFILLKLTGLGYALSPFYLQIAISRGVMPWGRAAIVLVLSYLLFLWAASAWHRFILLSERPGRFWPSVPWAVYWPFFRQSLWTGFLVLLVLFVGTFIAGIIFGFAGSATGRPPGWIAQGIAVLLSFPVLALTFRLAVNLPKAAVRPAEPLRTVWEATSGQFRMFIALFTLLVGIRVLATEAIVQLGLTAVTTAGFILVAATESLLTILTLSVVTTLYGHYVEKRPLV